MHKCFLVFSLAIPLCGYCQSFGDSSFRPISVVPSTANVEGWELGSTKANGILIDLFQSNPYPITNPDFDNISVASDHSWVDKRSSAHVFHYFYQYYNLNVIFGYDLRVEPVRGRDEIRCTFSALTDPPELPKASWNRDEGDPVVALPPDLTPFVIKSGAAISFTVLPFGPGRIAVVHYIRLTRTDLASASTQ